MARDASAKAVQQDQKSERSDVWRRRAARVIFGLAALGAMVLAVVVSLSDGEPEPDRALATAALVVLGLIPVALYLVPQADLQAALGRIKSVTIGSLGIELSDYAGLAGQAEVSEEDAGEIGETLLDLRVGLEMKLAYLAKHVFGPQPDPDAGDVIPAFITVGSLQHDGYLSKDHARIAYDILTMRSHELRSLTGPERRLFLKGAENFVKGIRSEIFTAQVKKELEDAHWRVLEASPQMRLRRDLIVQSTGTDGIQHHVIPVFAMSPDSTLFEKPSERLQKQSLSKAGGSRFIVVPPLSKASGSQGEVKIVTLKEMLAELHPAG